MAVTTVERDGAEEDEALERATGDRDHFGVFRRTAHEYRAKEVFRVAAILARKKNVNQRRDDGARVQTK